MGVATARQPYIVWAFSCRWLDVNQTRPACPQCSLEPNWFFDRCSITTGGARPQRLRPLPRRKKANEKPRFFKAPRRRSSAHRPWLTPWASSRRGEGCAAGQTAGRQPLIGATRPACRSRTFMAGAARLSPSVGFLDHQLAIGGAGSRGRTSLTWLKRRGRCCEFEPGGRSCVNPGAAATTRITLARQSPTSGAPQHQSIGAT